MRKAGPPERHRDHTTEPSPPTVVAVDDSARRPPGHLIVGIGASAGGLAAYQSFFEAMPDNTDMAFLLVQHLDPNYESALAEIIGECTAMPVTKARDGTVAAPNTVSVIPPNAILKIENGILRVAKPETATARRSSVDTFLVSLAQDQGENASALFLPATAVMARSASPQSRNAVG